MFYTPIINIAITLVLIYLLLSLIITSFNEVIVFIFKTRSRTLKKGLKTFLHDKDWEAVYNKILESPFINTLSEKKRNFPTYIPSKNFTLAFLDVIKMGEIEPISPDMIKKNSGLQGNIERLLLTLLENSKNDIDKFQKSLEEFFDNSMQKVSLLYKKRVQLIGLGVSIALAGVLNVDTIHISKELWYNPELAERSANFAVELSNQIETKDGNIIISDTSAGAGKFIYKIYVSADTTADFDSLSKKLSKEVSNIKNINTLFSQFPLPMGWTPGNYPSGDKAADLWEWLLKALGVLLTAFAISIGAPFWFDLLNKFVNLRGIAKQPAAEEKKETA